MSDIFEGNDTWFDLEFMQKYFDDMGMKVTISFDIRRFAGIHPFIDSPVEGDIPIRFKFEAIVPEFVTIKATGEKMQVASRESHFGDDYVTMTNGLVFDEDEVVTNG